MLRLKYLQQSKVRLLLSLAVELDKLCLCDLFAFHFQPSNLKFQPLPLAAA